jgi:hypothetical protein
MERRNSTLRGVKIECRIHTLITLFVLLSSHSKNTYVFYKQQRAQREILNIKIGNLEAGREQDLNSWE